MREVGHLLATSGGRRVDLLTAAVAVIGETPVAGGGEDGEGGSCGTSRGAYELYQGGVKVSLRSL